MRDACVESFEEGRLPHVHMSAQTRDALFRMLDLMVETGTKSFERAACIGSRESTEDGIAAIMESVA